MGSKQFVGVHKTSSQAERIHNLEMDVKHYKDLFEGEKLLCRIANEQREAVLQKYNDLLTKSLDDFARPLADTEPFPEPLMTHEEACSELFGGKA